VTASRPSSPGGHGMSVWQVGVTARRNCWLMGVIWRRWRGRRRRCRLRAGPDCRGPGHTSRWFAGQRGRRPLARRAAGLPRRNWAAVMNACRSVCGPTFLLIPARRATLRTTRPAPCRSSRRLPAVRNRAVAAFSGGQVDRQLAARARRRPAGHRARPGPGRWYGTRSLVSSSRAKPSMSARRTANRATERVRRQVVNWRRSSA
jgi:hypothetical protein